jgi:hypothetical protein
MQDRDAAGLCEKHAGGKGISQQRVLVMNRVQDAQRWLMLAKQSGMPAMQEALITQLCQERLGVFKIGGIEAFSEPAVNAGEHRAGFIVMTLLRE